jgi:pimeloyl-ACP methyl ester carboxylesterase
MPTIQLDGVSLYFEEQGTGSAVLLLDLLGPKRLAAVIARRLFPKPEQEALRARFVRSIAENDPDAYSRATRGLLGWSVLDRLGEIRCPVLVLASERDCTPTAMKRAYTAKLKDARLVELKDSGHAAPIDQPELVADAIERFLREDESAAGR